MYRQNSKDKNSKINKMSFVPSISPEPRLRPGTRDGWRPSSTTSLQASRSSTASWTGSCSYWSVPQWRSVNWFSDAHFDFLFQSGSGGYFIRQGDNPAYFPGRAELSQGQCQVIGSLGVLHPKDPRLSQPST